ncbi:MAG TPA: DUF6531 domain-containing protein [Actinomycetota bacterium]|nr:DUF6531 domain-containing protein [Actinomycetota bacterium]
MTFEGCAPPSGCTYDGGAIEVVNTSGAAVTVNSLTATFSTCTFNIWPANVSLPAGGTLIYTQTISGPSGGCQTNGSFDTSDVGPNGSTWSSCTNSGVIPLVNITVNNTAESFTDSAQVLNTGGIDVANCPLNSNESKPWTQVNGSLTPAVINGGGNVSAPQILTCNQGGYPVNCATGDFWHTFDELSVPGRGPALDFSLTYNSLSAAQASPLGFGWTFTYGMGLSIDPNTGNATVYQENGSIVPFTSSGGSYQAPAYAAVTLVHNGDGTYTFTRRHGGLQFRFSSAGQLLSITDRNGYATTLTYNGSGQLTTVTDPAGRRLNISYGTNGKISQVSDPLRQVGYLYDPSGNLATITAVDGGLTTFGYDPNHLLLTMTDPKGGKVTNTYNASAQVTAQTDAMNRTTNFTYSGGTTTITDPGGNITREQFSNGEPVAITDGYGTSAEATWTYHYDPNSLALLSSIDPNNHTATYQADVDGDPTSRTDAIGRTTSVAYNSFDEPTAAVDAKGVTTTMTYNSAGNLLTRSTPLVGSSPAQVQTVTYTYGDSSHPGDITSMTDADNQVWLYTYEAPWVR